MNDPHPTRIDALLAQGYELRACRCDVLGLSARMIAQSPDDTVYGAHGSDIYDALKGLEKLLSHMVIYGA